MATESQQMNLDPLHGAAAVLLRPSYEIRHSPGMLPIRYPPALATMMMNMAVRCKVISVVGAVTNHEPLNQPGSLEGIKTLIDGIEADGRMLQAHDLVDLLGGWMLTRDANRLEDGQSLWSNPEAPVSQKIFGRQIFSHMLPPSRALYHIDQKRRG